MIQKQNNQYQGMNYVPFTVYNALYIMMSLIAAWRNFHSVKQKIGENAKNFILKHVIEKCREFSWIESIGYSSMAWTFKKQKNNEN